MGRAAPRVAILCAGALPRATLDRCRRVPSSWNRPPPCLGERLRIGIDVALLQVRGGRHGIGSYLRGLLPALARRRQPHEYRLFAYAGVPLDLPPLEPTFSVVELPAPRFGRASAMLSHQLALPLLARRHRLSVLHIPHVSVTASVPGIPLWQPVPLVVTVHDLTPSGSRTSCCRARVTARSTG